MATTILEQLVHDSTRLRDRTKEIYLDAIERYLEFVGSTNPADWTGQSVVEWRKSIVADGVMKNQSANLLLKGLRFASRRRAEIECEPAVDFARVCELLRPEPREKRISLTVAEAQALVAACTGNTGHARRDLSVVSLMLRLGIRRSGLCGAVIENLRGNKLTFELKGGEMHTVDLDDEILDALRAWLSWLRSRGVRTGRIFRALKPSLSSNTVDIGEKLSPQRLYEIVRERATLANIGHCFPHRLRHSFVSIGLDAGIEPWRLRKVGGWKRELQLDDYTTDLRSRTTPTSAMLPPFVAK